MTEREACIAFNLLPDVGAVAVRRLAAMHGGIVAAWETQENPLDWDGREVRCRGILTKTMRMIHDCMADSGKAPDGCDCVFLVAYEHQEMPLYILEERKFCFRRDSEANECVPLVEDYCLMVGQCLFGVFGRFMK